MILEYFASNANTISNGWCAVNLFIEISVCFWNYLSSIGSIGHFAIHTHTLDVTELMMMVIMMMMTMMMIIYAHTLAKAQFTKESNSLSVFVTNTMIQFL